MEFARMLSRCQGAVGAWLLAAAAVAWLAGCGGTGLVAENRPEDAQGRMMLSTTGSGVFLVRAEVDGAGPYFFVLDTGSSRTVVSRRLVEEVGLAVGASGATVLGAEGGRVEVDGSVRLGRLRMGGAEFTGVESLVMDLSALERTLGARVDGIAAGSLFADRTLVLDFAAGEAWVTEERVRGGMRLRDDRLTMVRADVAGRAVDVVIDSASGGSWMLPRAGLAAADMGYGARRVETAGGGDRRARLELEGEIRLGGHVFERPMVEGTDGLARVGWHALRGYRVSIDRRGGLVQIDRVGGDVSDGPVWGIGARLERVGGVWEVRGIEPGRPADSAGLVDGERVLAVGGLRADVLDGAGLAGLIQRSPRLRLDVMRAGGVETVWVPVVYEQP